MVQKTSDDFDVIIGGAGPAGIFCAYELKQLKPNLKILILEKGWRRPIDDKNNNLFGWGGAGAFSDGKLDLTSKVGGQLVDGGYLSSIEFHELMKYVEYLYEKFGGKQELKIGDEAKIAEFIRRANAVGLELIPYPLKHWGREGAYELVEGLFENLKESGVKIQLGAEVISIAHPRMWQALLKNGETFWGKSLVIATGRAGADWTVKELKKHGVKTENNPADVGVRMEVKNSMVEELTSALYEFKLVYLTPKRRDRVRTFCVCPGGKVVKEQHADFVTVNGQTDNKQTDNTNFAILVSESFTEPFEDANAYGRYIAGLGTLLSNGSVLVQTLADWQNEKRSKNPQSLKDFPVKPTLLDAVPGNLRLVLPEQIFSGVNEMIEVLGRFIPGLNNGNYALLYGVEAKFYSRKVIFKKGFETNADGLYVVGDGSGVTRGLAQSSIMGIKAAREIADKLK